MLFLVALLFSKLIYVLIEQYRQVDIFMITYANVEPEFGVKQKPNPQSLMLTGIQSSRGRHAWLHTGVTRGCTPAMPLPWSSHWSGRSGVWCRWSVDMIQYIWREGSALYSSIFYSTMHWAMLGMRRDAVSDTVMVSTSPWHAGALK